MVTLDLDPQGSLANWGDRRESLEPGRLPRLPAILEGLAGKGFTIALLDTAGVDSAAACLAAQTADLCLMPARPTRLDIDATTSTFQAMRRPDATRLSLSINARYRSATLAPATPPLA